MLTFILLVMLAGSIPYLVVGARLARHRHALAMHDYRLALSAAQDKVSQKEAADQKIEELKTARDSLQHKYYCFLLTPTLKSRGCYNCDDKVTSKWQSYNSQIDALKRAGKLMVPPEAPATPYTTMLTWPVVKLQDYLTSGEVQKANPYTIAELESELNKFPELN